MFAAVVTGSGGYYLGTRHPSSAHTAGGDSGAAPAPPAPPSDPGQCGASAAAAFTGPSAAKSRLLRDLLPMPPGAERVSAPKIFSLRAFLTDLYPTHVATEQGFLNARCFQFAANREWRHSGLTVSVWLIRFAGTTGAESYALGQGQTDVTLLHGHGRTAVVSGIPAGRIVQTSRLDKFGETFTRMFGYEGNVAILIHVLRLAYLPAPAAVEPFLRRQARRMPAG